MTLCLNKCTILPWPIILQNCTRYYFNNKLKFLFGYFLCHIFTWHFDGITIRSMPRKMLTGDNGSARKTIECVRTPQCSYPNAKRLPLTNYTWRRRKLHQGTNRLYGRHSRVDQVNCWNYKLRSAWEIQISYGLRHQLQQRVVEQQNKQYPPRHKTKRKSIVGPEAACRYNCLSISELAN
jgi:hypothetical protein